MAKASRESITIEYCDSIGEFFKHQITEHEAESMYYALQDVLGIECVSGPDEKYDYETLVDSLKSIANNSCCGSCEEAKRVAEVALYKAGVVSSIPVRTIGTAGVSGYCKKEID
jgi:hypothetical protein